MTTTPIDESDEAYDQASEVCRERVQRMLRQARVEHGRSAVRDYINSAARGNLICLDCGSENHTKGHSLCNHRRGVTTLRVGSESYAPIGEVSDLLDEVFRLRRALAYESQVVEAQTLDLKSLGKSRRGHLEDCIERMQLAALGDSELAYAGTSSHSLRHAVQNLKAKETLTRWNWRNWRAEAPEERSES
jgi:hypothetical protein